MKDKTEKSRIRKKILVVDDDLLMRKSIANFLTHLGYDVSMAANGQQGLEAYKKERPDLMLLDLRMPEVDGIEVLETLQEELKTNPIIIVSGAGSMGDAVKAVKLGAWDYIVKPVTDVHIFENAIKRALDRASLIAENIRYQNYLEEEIKLRTAELHQAQKMEAIGTLAGGIAHDFNNILAIMTGYSQMAMEQLEEGSQPYQDLEKVMSAGQRATDLVKQILTFSRQRQEDMQPVQVQYILKEILKFLRASFPSTIQIKDDIDIECPTIMADPSELHQIIMNLCANAKQAMLDTGGVLQIELSHHNILPSPFTPKNQDDKIGKYVLLRVIDTGHGIPKTDLHRIFDPFFSTKPKNQGTGLGLSVVHGIVGKMNGDIHVESVLDRGTDFQLVFPAVRTETHDHQEILLDVKAGGGEHILVVDDDKEIASMMERILAKLGYKVTAFSESRQALEEFRKNAANYDLVITDMTMPDITGKQLAEAIMETMPGMPIIMCTGFSEVMDQKQAIKMGIREYIMKPIVKGDLSKIVRKVLNNG